MSQQERCGQRGSPLSLQLEHLQLKAFFCMWAARGRLGLNEGVCEALFSPSIHLGAKLPWANYLTSWASVSPM